TNFAYGASKCGGRLPTNGAERELSGQVSRDSPAAYRAPRDSLARAGRGGVRRGFVSAPRGRGRGAVYLRGPPRAEREARLGRAGGRGSLHGADRGEDGDRAGARNDRDVEGDREP